MTIHPFAFGNAPNRTKRICKYDFRQENNTQKGNGKVSLDKLRLYIQNTFPKGFNKKS